MNTDQICFLSIPIGESGDYVEVEFPDSALESASESGAALPIMSQWKMKHHLRHRRSKRSLQDRYWLVGQTNKTHGFVTWYLKWSSAAKR